MYRYIYINKEYYGSDGVLDFEGARLAELTYLPQISAYQECGTYGSTILRFCITPLFSFI
jgi:hypothetical protein